MDFNFSSHLPLVTDWLLAHGVRVALILACAYVLQLIVGGLIARLIRRVVRQGSGSKLSEEKRENTLIGVLSGAAYILIWITTLLMLLSEAGVAIGPLLAAAGIVGVAVGFGGQYLIRDLISGLFIIIENQYRVGDVVCFDTTCGLVEKVTLRMTQLRDLDGTVHHVPHGEIKKVSNLSKQYSRLNENIGIAYDSDLEQVIEVVNAVGKEMAEDPAWKEHIITAPAFLRVDSFGDSSIIIKVLGDTQPLKQWDVAGEWRKRIKVAFDRAGIVIPFPQRVVHLSRQEGM